VHLIILGISLITFTALFKAFLDFYEIFVLLNNVVSFHILLHEYVNVIEVFFPSCLPSLVVTQRIIITFS